MPNTSNPNTPPASSTAYAADLIARGYTPDEVRDIMKHEKIVFPTISGVLNELIGSRNLTVEIVAGRAAEGERWLVAGRPEKYPRQAASCRANHYQIRWKKI